MKKAFKRMGALCLAFIMIFSIAAGQAFAVETSCGDDLSWKIKDGTLTITGSGPMYDYTSANEAPWFEQRFDITKIEIGDKVTSIGNYAFCGLEEVYTADCGDVELIGNCAFYCCMTMDSVTLGDSLKYIGDNAFGECGVLSQVELPDTVETIGAEAFMGTCIEGDLSFGKALRSIGSGAFYMCYGITGVTIPDGTVSIGNHAFCGCEFVDTVSIGKDVISIGEQAFAGCTDLKEIKVASGNTHYKAVDNALLTKDGKTLLAYAIDSKANVTIPDSVVEISDFAFAGSYAIVNVTIPEGVKTIGDYAFADCWSLEKATLPKSLETIGDMAFAGDFSVIEMTVPENVSHIGEGAFSDMFGISAFKVAGNNSEYKTRDGVIFNSAETVLVACPGGKTGDYSVPKTVRTIAPYAFSGCLELDVTIQKGVETIGDGAFGYTYNIDSITIPETVTSIGENVFGSSMVSSVNVASGNKAYAAVNGVLFTNDMKTLIYYPGEKSGGSYTIPKGVTEISDHAFEYSKVKSVEIPDTVTSIGSYAFSYCENLADVTMGKGVKTIGEYAFSDCYSLTEVEIPYKTESIGVGAFAWCSELDTVVIGGAPYIDMGAFAWCNELDDVEFKANAPTDIGELVFYGCSDVFAITYADGMAGWTTPTWMGYDTKNDGEAEIISGDANCDGDITNADLILVARHIVGLENISIALGDVDGDGSISNTDLIAIARIIVGMN